MKKILFVLCIALVFVGCKKDSDNGGDASSFEFNNGHEGKLQMTVNTKETVSFTNGVTPSKVYIESTDESVVKYVEEDGAIAAYKEGTAVIIATLKTNSDITAGLVVTVTSYIENVQFYQIEYWGGSGEWDMKKYTIYRVHRLIDGCKQVVNTDHEGDTADIDSWMDEVQDGYWYYLYETEDGDSVGLFKDSIYSLKTYMMSVECLFNGKGIDLAGEQGMVLCIEDHFMFTSESWYCLGDRVFVEDVCEVGKQYVKTGQEKVPFPGAIQIGHFNGDNYVEYYGSLLAGESPEAADYPILDDHDCEFIMFYMYDDETSETGKSMGGLMTGYPILPTQETDCDIYFGITEDRSTMIAEYYDFSGKLFPNVIHNVGFKTELNDDGEEEWVQPFELDEMMEVNYVAGKYPDQMPARQSVNRTNHSEIPMPRAAMEKKMSFDRTIASTLRMVLAK